MSYTDDFNEAIISKKRSGTPDDPYKAYTITLQIVNSKVILPELPNRFEKVTISGAGMIMYEVQDGELNNNTYRVDYNQGVVFFNSINNGKSFTFSFLGEGLQFTPASSIWVSKSSENTIQTAKEKFDDLDAEITEQTSRIDNFLINSPQPSEVLDVRVDRNGVTYSTAKNRIDAEQKKVEDAYKGKDNVVYTSLKDRFDQTDDKLVEVDEKLALKANQVDLTATNADLQTTKSNLLATESIAKDAQAKASNPLAALSTAGYKLALSDLSTEVQNAMTGTTGITTAKGYFENNRGVEFPLKNITRDGTLYAVSQTVKDAILDVKVVNAEVGKVYTLAYVAKGLNSSYGFTIYEYDEATFASNSATSERRIAYYLDNLFTNPNDAVVTRTLESDNKVFIITVDYSKITTTALNISSTAAGVARGAIIDKSCYTYKNTQPKGLGYVENNRGVIFPLKVVRKDGVLSTPAQVIKDAVLDVKVINARIGKYYTLAFIANGHNGSYGFTIDEYDKATFETSSATGRSRYTYYMDNLFTAPTENPTTRTLQSGDTVFVVTIDYSKITTTSLNIDDPAASGQGKGCIIDESNYTYKPNNVVIAGENRFSFPMVAQKAGNVLGVKFSYSDTHNMIIEFDLLGINQITHLKRIYLQDKLLGTLDNNLTSSRSLLYDATSDWISPYRIEALNNGNGNTLFTTGANHGTDNGTGFPTARNGGATIYADDIELKDNEVAFANKVVIKTVQYVSAFNAVDKLTGDKRDSLKEVVYYTFTPNCMNIALEFEALEDLNVKNYAGLQMQKGAWGGNIYFMEDTGKPQVFDISGSNVATSSTKPNGQPDRWVAKKDGNVAIAYYDTALGLGTRTYVSDTEDMLYTTDTKIYGKLLYNTVGVTLPAGQSFFWSGGYAFTKGLECVGAETAYTLRLSDHKKVYVVDFINAADTYLKVEPTDYNKRVTVLSKSNSITCGNFISSRGLKITATGYGQLKFIVG